MFGHLKDFRHISTHYVCSATNLMAAVHIAVTATYWS